MLTIYRASAGSGKTYTLAKEYISLLFGNANDRPYRRILAVTFTHKATNEMKTRILDELRQLATQAPSAYRAGLCTQFHLTETEVDKTAKRLLIEILQDFSAFSVSTIDSFFQQIIRSFAREMGMPSSYGIDLDSDELLVQAIDNLFFDLDKTENTSLLAWLTQFAEEQIENGNTWDLHHSIEGLGKEIFKESYQSKLANISKDLHSKDFLKNYRSDLRQLTQEYENSLQTAAQSALRIMQQHNLSHNDIAYSCTSKLDKMANNDSDIYKTDKDVLGVRFRAMVDVTCCYKKASPRKADIETAYNEGFGKAIQTIIDIVDKDSTRYNTASIILKNLNTLGILADLSEQVERITHERNTMPLANINRLLNGIIDNSDTPFVYEKTGINIHHFMIDEFQDTSTLQWQNFRPLVSESLAHGHANLLVGDVKQSIYRWRNSDWTLLAETVQREFPDAKIPVLDTNWRSFREIVEFNNTFFAFASQTIQQDLQESICKAGLEKQLAQLPAKIENAYATLHQKAHKSDEGYVQIRFIETNSDQKKDEIEQIALEQVNEILQDTLSRHASLAGMAILVRKNEEAQSVAKYLTSKGYQVISNEGLRIAGAASVHFLLGIMQLILQPNDLIQRAMVYYLYAHYKLCKTSDKAMEISMQAPTNVPWTAFFSTEEQAELEEIGHLTLYDLTERTIALFGLDQWNGESMYVQAFQDLVFSFAATNTADVGNFLTWWEQTGCKKTIPTPQAENAIQITTVHKAKGLEFRTVIIPFATWPMVDSRKILWSQLSEEPFSKLPLMPINDSPRLRYSLFAQDYYNEKMQSYMDSLNVSYVAFTRAKEELYCIAPLSQKKEQSNATIAQLLYNGIQQHWADQWDDTVKQCTLGHKTTDTSPAPAPASGEVWSTYPTAMLRKRLQIRHLGADYLLRSESIQNSPLNLGTLMHELLCGIKRRTDQPAALANMLASGRISQAEAKIVEKEMDKFWEIAGVSEWFTDNYTVRTEVTLLNEDGHLCRPDRLMFDGQGNATIVDYKFGHAELTSHKEQVHTYRHLLQQMGHKTQAYLCYVELGKVVPVA